MRIRPEALIFVEIYRVVAVGDFYLDVRNAAFPEHAHCPVDKRFPVTGAARFFQHYQIVDLSLAAGDIGLAEAEYLFIVFNDSYPRCTALYVGLKRCQSVAERLFRVLPLKYTDIEL